MNVFTNIPSHVEIVGLKTQPKKQQIRIGEDETFAPPSWKTRDLTRKQKTRNLIAAAICLLFVGVTMFQVTRLISMKNIFRDDPHVASLINELKKEEYIAEEKRLAREAAAAAAPATANNK